MNRRPLALLVCTLVWLLSACSGGGGGGGDDAGPATVTLSGTIRAATNLAVDTDTNDPQSPYAPNNFLTTAQIIGNPVMVGGYVTALPTGIQGERFASSADMDDVYAVDLTQGQTIVLEVSEPATADIDLGLYDAGGALVDASLGVDRFESVTAAVGGRYFLRVNAFDGGANYVLSVGTGTVPAASLKLSSEFRAGEAIVLWAPGAAKTSTAANALGLAVRAGGPGRPMLYAFPQVGGATAAARPAPLEGTRMSPSQAEKLDTLYRIKTLRKRADVQGADPNFIVRPSAVPNDPFYALQWHYPLINLPQAWDITTGTPASGDVVVAVVDTGVFLAHADLAGRFLMNGGNVVGFDFIADPQTANDGDGIDANPNDPGDESTPASSSWHGTHVAGTVAAGSNNGLGVGGVSWGAKLMPVRVLGKGGGTSYDVMQGVRYAAGLANDSGTLPVRRADIINLSLGCLNCFSSTAQSLYNEVRNAGVIVVAAAGNESTPLPSYPAAYTGVVSVSAVTLSRGLAPYSNFGSTVDVAGPGGDSTLDMNGDGYPDGVLSSLVGAGLASEYAFYQGTSMAAPHVAGVAALMKAVHPALTPGDFDALLAAGSITSDLGAAGRDDSFGWGLIDAAKAVVQARQLASGTAVATLEANPGRFDFGASITSAALQLTKLGSGALSVTGVTDDAAWLTVTPTGVDAGNLGSYGVSVNRAGLSAGSYSATITISASTGGQVRLPVSMLVVNEQIQVNTGQYWVLLTDQDYNLVSQLNLVSGNGLYPFQFANLPKGTYYLFAGTDSDWDDLICDMGEACGAYPTLSDPVLISADTDRGGLDFGVGFSLSPGAPSSAVADQVRKVRRATTDKGVSHE